MKLKLFCQSIQKNVQNVVGQGGQTARQTTFAINLQTHNGDGRAVDPAVQSGSFGWTAVSETAPDFDAGDLVEIEISKAQLPAAAQTPQA